MKILAVKTGIIFYALFVISGCASIPKPDEMKADVAAYQLPKLPEDGKAVVYVVRPSTFGQGFSSSVFVDNQEPKSQMGYTMGSQYIYFNLAPGNHKILSKIDDWAEINVSVKPGDIIFIKLQPSMGMVSINNKLLILQDYEGKYYVKTLSIGTFTNDNRPTAATAQAMAQQGQSATAETFLGTYKGAPIKDSSTPAPVIAPSVNQAGTIAADKAMIYLYRLPGKTGFAAFASGDSPPPFGVKANGKTLVTLTRGGYYIYLTEPGHIEFTTFEVGFMAPNTVFSITVEAKAGQAYYIKGSHGKGSNGRARLEFVTPEVGAGEIVNCKAIIE